MSARKCSLVWGCSPCIIHLNKSIVNEKIIDIRVNMTQTPSERYYLATHPEDRNSIWTSTSSLHSCECSAVCICWWNLHITFNIIYLVSCIFIQCYCHRQHLLFWVAFLSSFGIQLMELSAAFYVADAPTQDTDSSANSGQLLSHDNCGFHWRRFNSHDIVVCTESWCG